MSRLVPLLFLILLLSLPCSAASHPFVFTTERFGDSEIASLHDDGSVHNLTHSDELESYPAISPDGRFVAYSKSTNGVDVWVMNIDGSNHHAITSEPSFDSNPSWSPDGRKLAFTTTRFNGTSRAAWVALDANGNAAGAVHEFPTPAGTSVTPVWSPDGAQIVFAHATPGQSAFDLWVMNSDGSNARNLTNSAADEQQPAWSSLNWIAYRHFQNGRYDIRSFQANAPEVSNIITDDAHFDRRPAWSPDGSQLAWESNRSGNNDVWVIDVGGTTHPVTQRTFDPALDGQPHWGTAKGSLSCPAPSDVSVDDPEERALACLVCNRVAAVSTDGSAAPDSTATRAILAAWIVKAHGWPLVQPVTPRYLDVPPSHWAFAYVETLAAKFEEFGYAAPGSEQLFSPNQQASRAMLAYFLARSARLPSPSDGQATFADVPSTSGLYGTIEAIVRAGWKGGFACGSSMEPCDAANRPYMRPHTPVTRAQAAKMIATILLPACTPAPPAAVEQTRTQVQPGSNATVSIAFAILLLVIIILLLIAPAELVVSLLSALSLWDVGGAEGLGKSVVIDLLLREISSGKTITIPGATPAGADVCFDPERYATWSAAEIPTLRMYYVKDGTLVNVTIPSSDPRMLCGRVDGNLGRVVIAPEQDHRRRATRR